MAGPLFDWAKNGCGWPSQMGFSPTLVFIDDFAFLYKKDNLNVNIYIFWYMLMVFFYFLITSSVNVL
jgi:hypothetical protein